MQEHHRPAVTSELAPYVVGVSGYRLSGFDPGVHVGMPSPSLTVIVPFDDPIRVAAPGEAPLAYDSLVSGLYDAPVHIHHDGSQHGVQLDLTPAGARALLGVPAGAISQQMVDLDELAGVGSSLAEQSAAAQTWQARVDVVLDVLTRRLRRDAVREARPEVVHAWAEIRRTQGRVPVWAVASAVGWSTRHLGERFRTEYGVSPKTAARLTRFDRAHRLVASGVPLAETAVRCGYTDQAHLNRDWRGFVGLSPTRWAIEDQLAFVQDGAYADT
ncbi:MAG: AraC family transcriptional regulator [Nocardioidaceae bacterium]|nr:AraC family transcriptional regulator [Nocardioidaceae bacterium]